MGKKEEQKFQKWFEEEWMPSLKPELHNSAKALFNDEQARTELMNGYLRQTDYTTKTQELADARKQMESELAAERQTRSAYEQQVQSWYTQANTEYVTAQQELAELRGKLAKTGPSFGAPTMEQSDLLKKIEKLEQNEAKLIDHVRKVDLGALNTVTTLSGLAYRALKEGYSYDPNEILKISQSKNIPLDRAFDEFTASERAEKEKAAREAEREKMREELKREILSNRTTPDAMGPENPVLNNLFGTKQGQSKTDFDIVREAVQDFNEGLANQR